MLSDSKVSKIIQLKGSKFTEEFVRWFDREWTETVEKIKRKEERNVKSNT